MSKKHPTDLKQVSALLKWALAEPGYQTIADYGAGTGEAGPREAEAAGKRLLRYDPFLPHDVNQELFDDIYRSDVLISANVLNVLVKDQELEDAIKWLLELSARTKTGTAVVTVYNARVSSETQRAEPLSWYAQKVRALTKREVTVKYGRMFILP